VTIPQASVQNPTPELLAPAGNLNAALVAFESGADAVYAGLPRFNARERTENFTIEDFGKLVTFARREGKKVYLTFNTLVKETEVDEAATILADVARLGPHAVIVQDIGVLRLLREAFPWLAIHASTQMGVHNSAGTIVLERMGVERVILERQVTLDEIAGIVSRSPIEVEVFVHGALCCCLSGSCLLSSWMGGWSGNRGKCKQPCRRRYFAEDGNGFFLSTNDLYSLDAIPRLREMGVASLKIEGRLRQADYVRSVVTAYRMMLDAEPANTDRVLKEARAVLAGSLGRKWSRGFRTPNDLSTVIESRSLGSSGLLCGTVTDVQPGGFRVRASHPLRVGERIRVQPDSGDEGPSVELTRLSLGRRHVNAVKRGQECFVHCDKPVPVGGRVFKIALHCEDLTARVADVPSRSWRSDLSVRISHTAVDVDASGLTWHHPMEIPDARSRPLTSDTVATEFAKTGDDTFFAGRIEVSIDGALFIHNKELRALRRCFWDWARENLPDAIAGSARDALRQLRRRVGCPALPRPTPGETVVRVANDSCNPMPGTLTARLVRDATPDTDEIILPAFCPEDALPELRKAVTDLLDGGHRRFRVTSLYGLDLLPGRDDVILTASFPLPIANSLAVAELATFGFLRFAAWVELEQEARDALRATGGRAIECLCYGRIPLLTTRARLPKYGRVTDSRGQVFELIEEGALTHVFADRPLAVPAPADAPLYYDLSRVAPGEDTVSRFNLDRELA